ncbi:MAG: type phosphodiesterase/nucleotide pyrophosphatase [Verrucomicrobiaceae bacterium]|nr:type phosphodiesterase/nucleotide pyrophosphatase [Verrucomicrobiaceae bacterium]
MRFSFRSLARAALAALSLLSLNARAADAAPDKDRHVILISLDGFPAWIWRDPNLAIPNLRRLAAEGAVADAMTVSNPSVTWINHTTLVTGVNPEKHGVLYNGLLVRQGPTTPPTIMQWADKDKLVHVPTLYDTAFNAGLTTAEVDWVAVKNAPTINWSFAEIPSPEGVIEKELQVAGLLSPDQLANIATPVNITARDMQWTNAAAHILKTHKPNLLMFHLLTTDSVNHTYGPGTLASLTAYANADQMVGQLLRALKESGLEEKTSIVVTTDHGFKKVEKLIYPNVALRKAGFLKALGPKVTSCDGYVFAQGGIAFAFVTDPARKAELLPKLKETLEKVEGIDKVIDGTDGPKLGMPLPENNQGMGDLILYPKPGYAFQSLAAGDDEVVVSTSYLGTHGYPNTDPDLDGIFVAWGKGIKPGMKLDRVANIDVAPTLARLLGIQMPPMDGRVLEEILEPVK